ncbi:MAG: Asp-tRNA(Asn)/Glu-tRNA(Gln) amidotransferase subunit GatB [Anaerolineales bacterium]
MPPEMACEAVIGLEVHAEMQTATKMFCGCPVVDFTTAAPNTAVCPVCAGMPGALPVINRQAVVYALRVALALDCQVAETSIFARKNYFYPDLPKGYQISQYEAPLAENGHLFIQTPQGARQIRVRRVHLEEDTGRLAHYNGEEAASLIDLNRSGVALLEIVSEPDMHTALEARAYGETLRRLLRALGVNSGDMEKGVMRFEANVSVRPRSANWLGNRVEIKNLNSFRALERAITCEIERQSEMLQRGETIPQQTVGWDEASQQTFIQRSKEEAHDYRYFPEPDLPPLVVSADWLAQIRASLPELPQRRQERLQTQYGLPPESAALLTEETSLADYFEALAAATRANGPTAANWMLGALAALCNANNRPLSACPVAPQALGRLIDMVTAGEINQNTGREVLAEMFTSGLSAPEIVAQHGLTQISDEARLRPAVVAILEAYPQQVSAYLNGKEGLFHWLFGQVMQSTGGQANPQVVRRVLQDEIKQRAG